MLEKAKFTADELALMSFFESITGVSPIDCIIGEDNVVFIIKSEDYQSLLRNAVMAYGRSRNAIEQMLNELSRVVKKRVDVIKFYPNPEQFLRSFFSLRRGEEVKLINRPDGNKYAIVYVNPRRRGAVIGKSGFKAKQARQLAKKYFNLQTIFIR